MKMTTSIYEVPVNRADGSATTLGDYRGKALLIVNVASACGLTPQYAALEKIFETYRERGLMVLGFPCNDFGAQEPGTAEEIQTFCSTKYNVEFPVLQKLSVKPSQRHPLYANLIDAQPKATFKPGSDFKAKLEGYGMKQENDSDILWNFEKFLVSKDGQVIARFSPDTSPDDPTIVAAIEKALA
jgi:glutathione peroxidase